MSAEVVDATRSRARGPQTPTVHQAEVVSRIAASSGVKRYMLGREPILDGDGARLADARGRPSYVTSAGSGPSVGKHVLMSYLPREHAQEGAKLQVQYMGERYPVTVEVVGARSLFDPDNTRVRA